MKAQRDYDNGAGGVRGLIAAAARVERWKLVLIATVAVAVALGARWWFAGGPSSQGQEVVIGAILPQTGPGAVFAQYISEGIELAAEEINAAGLPHVRVVYEDSKNQPREGVTVYNKLVSTDDPPVVIVALSSVAKALAPLAAQSDTVQVYIAVALPDITDGEHTFRVYPEAQGMAGVMARFNATRLNAQTSAVIYVNDDFGRVSMEAYRKEFEKSGGRVVFTDSYELQQADFRPLIGKLKSTVPAPNTIYLNGYGPSYGAIVRQLREQNVQSQLTADMTMGLPNTLDQAGEAADGVYFADGYLSPEFAAKFTKRYGREPSSYAGYAYDIVKLIYKTREKGVYNPRSVKEGLLEVRDYQGATGRISIKPDGDADLQFTVKRVTGQLGRPEEVTEKEVQR